jgi:hypothetical protein
VFQSSADSWVKTHNAYRKRRDKRTSLPTGVQPIFSYSNPAHFNTTDQLVPIPPSRVDELLEKHYPNLDHLFTHTPAFFHNIAFRIFTELGYNFQNLEIGRVWNVFDSMLPRLQLYFPQHFFSDSSDDGEEAGQQETEEGTDDDDEFL